MTPEGKVKKAVKDVLVSEGVYFFMPPANGYGRAGIPDFVGCCAGRFFAVECKAKDGPLTALQEREVARIREHDAPAWVVYPDGLGAFKEHFGEWVRSTRQQ